MVKIKSNITLKTDFSIFVDTKDIMPKKRECVVCGSKNDLNYIVARFDKRYRYNYLDFSFYSCAKCDVTYDFYAEWEKEYLGNLHFFVTEKNK